MFVSGGGGGGGAGWVCSILFNDTVELEFIVSIFGLAASFIGTERFIELCVNVNEFFFFSEDIVWLNKRNVMTKFNKRQFYF